MSQAQSKALTDQQWPIGKKSAYYTLFIVTMLGVFDFMDRQVLAALMPYLKEEYALSDTQLGFLVAIVNISIAILVIPSGYLIDRWSRKKMIAIMGVMWSLATGMCAMAGTYGHLVLARFFVGAGEAGYNPAAQSLLASSFPRSLRSTALGVLQFGIAAGAPLGMLAGAYIASHWGWRHAFGIVAIPGFILALLALGIRDFKTAPQADRNVAKQNGKAPECVAREPYLVSVLTLLRTRSLLCVYFAQAFVMLYAMTLANWLPSYFNREAGLSVTQASGFSAVFLVCSSAVTLLSGPLMDMLRARNVKNAILYQAVACMTGCVLMVTSFVYAVPGSLLQMVGIIASYMFAGTLNVLGFSLTADLSLPHLRGTAVSLLVTIQNVFGMALGPLLTGLLSDRFSLGTGMALMGLFPMLSGILYLGVYLYYESDLAKLPTCVVDF